jgi:hypothetical protein
MLVWSTISQNIIMAINDVCDSPIIMWQADLYVFVFHNILDQKIFETYGIYLGSLALGRCVLFLTFYGKITTVRICYVTGGGIFGPIFSFFSRRFCSVKIELRKLLLSEFDKNTPRRFLGFTDFWPVIDVIFFLSMRETAGRSVGRRCFGPRGRRKV